MIATYCSPCAASAPEVLEQRDRLDRAAGLRRHEKQRVLEVERELLREDRGRVGRVEHVQTQAPLPRVFERAPQDLGREARAAHPEQYRIGESRIGGIAGERLELVDLVGVRVGCGQPAEAVGDLGLAGRAPERVVLGPDPARDALLLGTLDARVRSRGSSVVGQRCVDRRGAAREDRLALGLDAGEQLLHRRDECRDAVAQQLVGDVVDVDAGLGQRLKRGRRVLVARSRPARRAASAQPPAASASASC